MRVDGARQDLLADAGFTQQQHADRCARRARRLFVDGAHRRIAHHHRPARRRRRQRRRRRDVGHVDDGRAAHDHAGGAEQDALAHRQVRLAAHELAHAQRLVRRAGSRPLAHEDAVCAADVLNLDPVRHPEHRVLARHGGIVDADRVPLAAPDRHLAGTRQIERPHLFAQEDDQLQTPLPASAATMGRSMSCGGGQRGRRSRFAAGLPPVIPSRDRATPCQPLGRHQRSAHRLSLPFRRTGGSMTSVAPLATAAHSTRPEPTVSWARGGLRQRDRGRPGPAQSRSSPLHAASATDQRTGLSPVAWTSAAPVRPPARGPAARRGRRAPHDRDRRFARGRRRRARSPRPPRPSASAPGSSS